MSDQTSVEVSYPVYVIESDETLDWMQSTLSQYLASYQGAKYSPLRIVYRRGQATSQTLIMLNDLALAALNNNPNRGILASPYQAEAYQPPQSILAREDENPHRWHLRLPDSLTVPQVKKGIETLFQSLADFITIGSYQVDIPGYDRVSTNHQGFAFIQFSDQEPALKLAILRLFFKGSAWPLAPESEVMATWAKKRDKPKDRKTKRKKQAGKSAKDNKAPPVRAVLTKHALVELSDETPSVWTKVLN